MSSIWELQPKNPHYEQQRAYALMQRERIEQMVPEIRKKLVEDLCNACSEDQLTDDGVKQLAKVAVWNKNRFPEVRRLALIKITTRQDFRLTRQLVTELWLSEEEKYDKREFHRMSRKTFVLGYLFRIGYDEVDPAISHGEMFDLLSDKEIRNKQFVPKFAGVLQDKFDEPPYDLMYAQIILAKSEGTYQRIAESVGLRPELRTVPFARLSHSEQEKLAAAFLEED